jgi:hypothetical protein
MIKQRRKPQRFYSLQAPKAHGIIPESNISKSKYQCPPSEWPHGASSEKMGLNTP